MNILVWLRYKWLSDRRMTWYHFKVGGVTPKSGLLRFYKLGLRFIGLLLSVGFGLGIVFLCRRIIGLTTDLSWIAYITLQYIIYGPIVDSMLALNAVSKAELPLLKSILGVRPAHLSLIELVYYAEYTFNLSALSDTVMLLSCAIALKTSLWSALLIAIISQPLRFALIFLFMGIRKASSFTQNLKTKHKPLVWLLSGLLVLAFILLSLRLTIASGNLPAIQSFNLNSLGTHLINNLKTIDFTSLSLYSWYPGTMVIQIALHADFLALLKLILTIVFLSALGYILAILNARQEQQHVATEITPLLTDGVLLQQYRHKLGLTYTYLKTLFLNPKFTRGKTFIEILVFTILLLAIVTRFSDQVSRQALLFIGFFALLFSNRASFKLDSPLVFSLAELQAFSNIPLKTLLGHKVLAAWLAHYLEIAAVLMLSCFCLNNGQAFLTLWLWVLLLLVGKTCLIPWGSSCLVGLSTSNQPNNKVTAKSTIYLHRLSTTAPLFLVLLVLYNPRSLSTLTFLGTMVSYLVLTDVMIALILRLSQLPIIQNHSLRLLGMIIITGSIFALPLVGLFAHFYSGAIVLMFGLVWFRLLWLCFNLNRRNPLSPALLRQRQLVGGKSA